MVRHWQPVYESFTDGTPTSSSFQSDIASLIPKLTDVNLTAPPKDGASVDEAEKKIDNITDTIEETQDDISRIESEKKSLVHAEAILQENLASAIQEEKEREKEREKKAREKKHRGRGRSGGFIPHHNNSGHCSCHRQR